MGLEQTFKLFKTVTAVDELAAYSTNVVGQQQQNTGCRNKT